MNQKVMPQTGPSTQETKPSNESGASTSQPSGGSSSHAATALKEGLTAGARDVTAEAKQVVGDIAGEAKKVADSKLDAGKDFAAERLGSVAQALRQTSQQLRSEDSGITEYVDKAAKSVDQVSTYLQTRTLSQLIGDVESYARREPAVFLGGAFFVGLLGGRFLKAATPSPRPSRPQTSSPSTTSREPMRLTQGSQDTGPRAARPTSDVSSTARDVSSTASMPASSYGNGSSPRLPNGIAGSSTSGSQSSGGR